MVLQLAPGVPLVWRSPTGIQLGAARALVVLDGVTPAYERLLAALEAGISETGFAMMARAAGTDPERLLAVIAPALATPPPVAVRAAVYGSGELAEELVRELGRSDDPELVILVAPWVIAPSDHGTWLRRDMAHLPVTVGDRITIGPLVVPGESACLHCVHLARRDADPAWPAIATQLHGRAAPALSRAAVAEAASFVARHVAGDLRAAAGTSWELDPADGAISARTWQRHPACSCAAPTGSDWAPAAARADLRATSSGSAAAVPA